MARKCSRTTKYSGRAANLKTGDYIDGKDIPTFVKSHEEITASKQTDSTFKEKLDSTEKDLILSALKKQKEIKQKLVNY